MQEPKAGRLAERTVDYGLAVMEYCESLPRTADFVHKMKVAMKELKESWVWLIFASRLAPCEALESLRAESRELLLMVGKSINTASGRMQGKTIGA